jgi:hypothetical protein
MAIADEIKNTLTDPTPLYALAGAGDLAYEKLREVPAKVEALASDRQGTQQKATAKLHEAQARLAQAQAKVNEKVNETVGTLPTDLKSLQEKAQGFALQQVGRAVELAVKAKETYDELAERGKAVIEQGTIQPESVTIEVVVDPAAEPAEAGEPIEGELVTEPAPTEDASAPSARKRTTKARKTGAAE